MISEKDLTVVKDLPFIFNNHTNSPLNLIQNIKKYFNADFKDKDSTKKYSYYASNYNFISFVKIVEKISKINLKNKQSIIFKKNNYIQNIIIFIKNIFLTKYRNQKKYISHKVSSLNRNEIKNLIGFNLNSSHKKELRINKINNFLFEIELKK